MFDLIEDVQDYFTQLMDNQVIMDGKLSAVLSVLYPFVAVVCILLVILLIQVGVALHRLNWLKLLINDSRAQSARIEERIEVLESRIFREGERKNE